jgi:hypothetical protein
LLELRVDDQKVNLQVLEGAPVRVRVYGGDYEVDARGLAIEQRQPGELTSPVVSRADTKTATASNV